MQYSEKFKEMYENRLARLNDSDYGLPLNKFFDFLDGCELAIYSGAPHPSGVGFPVTGVELAKITGIKNDYCGDLARFEAKFESKVAAETHYVPGYFRITLAGQQEAAMQGTIGFAGCDMPYANGVDGCGAREFILKFSADGSPTQWY